MDENEKKVYDTLEALGIEYKRYEHPPVHTMEDVEALHLDLEGEMFKSLFLRNQKGDKHYLVVLRENKRADLAKITSKLGATKLSFASAERLMEHLKLVQGCVGPFGLINDETHEVIVLLDKDVNKLEKISFHPNSNEATITLSTKDFLRFMESTGNTVKQALFI